MINNKNQKNNQEKNKIGKVLFSFISLFTLLSLFLISSNIVLQDVGVNMLAQTNEKTDFPPVITYFDATPNPANTTTTIIASVSDDIRLTELKLYEDGNLIYTMSCSTRVCSLTKTITKTLAGEYDYTLIAKDSAGKITNSNIVTVIFNGFNHNPTIDSWIPTNQNPSANENSLLSFSVTASDIDGDSLNYIWKVDNIQVGTNRGYNYNLDYFSSGNHLIYVIVSDGKGGTAVKTWNLTVNNILIPTTCTLTIIPTSPNVYGIETTVSCNCLSNIGTITETNTILRRNGIIVTTTENNQGVILPVGTHNYWCYTQQTTNFAFAEENETYIINRANPNIHLALNGIENNLNLIYGTQSNSTGWVETTQGINNARLYRDGILINSGSPVSEINILGAGVYNYTYNYSQSQNYTAETITRILTIERATSTCEISFNPISPSIYGTFVTPTCVCTNPESATVFTMDGERITNNAPILMSTGFHEFQCYTRRSQNYTAAMDRENYTIIQQTSTCTLEINPASPIIYGTQTNASCSCDNPETNARLFRDNLDVTATENNQNILLGAGIYNYVCNASETQNYGSAEDTETLIVNRDNSEINLLLNNTDGNITANEFDFVPIFAELINPTNGNIEIYNNGISIYDGISPYSNVLSFTTGVYNITAIYPENQNYSSSYETHFITVIALNTAPNVVLISPINNTVFDNPQQIEFNFMVLDDYDINLNCNLYLDENLNQTISATNGNLNSINIDGISLGNHSWRMECQDSEGLIGISEEWNFEIVLRDIAIDDTYTSTINGIRVSFENGTIILDDPAILYYNNNYSVRARINNLGTQLENINTTFYLQNSTNTIYLGEDSNFGVNLFYYADLILNEFEISEFSGDYNLIINTTILGYTDYDLTNNERQRMVRFELLDLEAPYYYDENVNPTSPVFYGNDPYTFSINWTDNVQVEEIQFIFEGQNYTPICTPNIPSMSTICEYTFNELAAGIYTYSWSASDPSDNFNSTGDLSYTIIQQTSTCTLEINPASPIIYGTQTNASCSCDNPETNARLFRDNLDVTATENNQNILLGAGIYNYVCNASETQNYGSAEDTEAYLILPASPLSEMHLAINNLEADQTFTYPITTNASGWNDLVGQIITFNLYQNGNLISNPNINELSAGVYTYIYNTSGNQNYTAETITRILTIEQALTQLTLIATPNWTIYDGMQSNISCSADNSEVIINLYRDNILINSENNYVEDTTTLPMGNYNYICNTSGNQNYTSDSENNILTILPKEPGIIQLFLNGIENDLSVEYLNNPINATAISLFNNVTLYRNGILIGENYNFAEDISTLSAGIYTYYANSSGNATHYPANITRQVVINKSSPNLEIIILPSTNVIYGTETTAICNIVNTNEIDSILEFYRMLAGWTNTTQIVSNPDINILAGGIYTYICNVSESENYTSGSVEQDLTINRANSSIILLLDGLDSNITRIEGNVINHTAIINLFSIPNIVNARINIYNPSNNLIYSSEGVSPYTILYNYTVPGLYRAEALFDGTENYTGSSTEHYLNITPIIHDSNVINITYNKSNSTVYLDDVVSVFAYIRNDGNVPENINVTLEDNGEIIAWQILSGMFANETVHETRQIEFIWNAKNDLWRTITINAVPLEGETNLLDNQKSLNIRVWKVCDVIECSEFYPRTTKTNYTLGEYFNASLLIVNKWNDEQFYDLKLELNSTDGLFIDSSKVIYMNLSPAQTTVKRWPVKGIDYGIETIYSYAGNKEYLSSKQITIN